MLKNVIAIGLIIVACHYGFSNSTGINDTLNTKTVLYKVMHSESDKVSYLFGTHHAFGKPFFESLKGAKNALLSANLMIKENLNIPGHLAVDIINKRTSTTNWKRYLDKKDLEYILEIFASSTLLFDRMTPAELYAFLSRHYKEQVCVKKDSTANYASLDDYIADVAEAHQIPVIGLETTEEQITLINQDIKGMPRKVHRKRLSNMIARIKSKSNDLCTETDWYKRMEFDFKLNEPCNNVLLLSDRNQKWLLQLKGHLKAQNCFIVVGLSHLMYDCGLIKQLQGYGYTITSVPVK